MKKNIGTFCTPPILKYYKIAFRNRFYFCVSISPKQLCTFIVERYQNDSIDSHALFVFHIVLSSPIFPEREEQLL